MGWIRQENAQMFVGHALMGSEQPHGVLTDVLSESMFVQLEWHHWLRNSTGSTWSCCQGPMQPLPIACRPADTSPIMTNVWARSARFATSSTGPSGPPGSVCEMQSRKHPCCPESEIPIALGKMFKPCDQFVCRHIAPTRWFVEQQPWQQHEQLPTPFLAQSFRMTRFLQNHSTLRCGKGLVENVERISSPQAGAGTSHDMSTASIACHAVVQLQSSGT